LISTHEKIFLVAPIIILTFASFAWRSCKTDEPISSAVDRDQEKIVGTQESKIEPDPKSESAINTTNHDSEPNNFVLAHSGGVSSQNRNSADISQDGIELRKAVPAAAISPQVSLQLLDVSGPSIGAVKVIGHRGCDTNTQGWYLGKGKPEEYDYTESEDGETLVVQRNVQNLTGAFEFVHCVDANQIAGKHIQFRVKLKAQDVKDVAQLRLWGENASRERILFKSEKVIGTYDWKDFAIEADIPSEVTLFNYGITFKNSGKLWVSRPIFGVSQ
jgi:hypothetical protein